MNHTLQINILIWSLLALAVVFLLGKIVIYFLREGLGRLNVKRHKKWLDLLDRLLAPLCILLFFVINLYYQLWPFTVLLVVIYGLFRHYIHDYMLGLSLHINKRLSKDASVQIKDKIGNIERLAYFGIWVNSDSGLHYYPYSALHPSGFTILHSSNISSNYHVYIVKQENIDIDKLKTTILLSPLIDASFPVSISESGDVIDCKVKLRSEQHYSDFCQYLSEHQYKIKS